MINADYIPAGIFKKVLAAVKHSEDQLLFECSATGIKIQAMIHCQRAIIELGESGFKQFRCNSAIAFTISKSLLNNIFVNKDDEDFVLITTTETSNIVQIQIVYVDEKVSSIFTIPKIQTSNGFICNTVLDPDCIIKLNTKEFVEILEDLSHFNKIITMRYDNTEIQFQSMGCGTALHKLTKHGIVFESDAEVAESIDSSFLVGFIKVFNYSGAVTLKFSPGCPLEIKFPLEAPHGTIGNIVFLCLPSTTS